MKIEDSKGKLGVLIPGLGAVSTTFIAGVYSILKGAAQPIGSLTQMGTIRLGKRTDKRSPLIKDFVPLVDIKDIVFGGWDIFEENCYESAVNSGVLKAELLDQVKDELTAIKPMKAVFDRNYVKKLDGPNVKTGESKYDLAMQLIEEIQDFKKNNDLARMVMIWCGSTEIFMKQTDTHTTIEKFEEGMKN
ncbi:MAG: inositol-3-phosphate synthase, partial [bacterium]|nr:inositol-3-phosphate synthase [bacterium]